MAADSAAVLVVYHSQSGRNQRLAQAVAAGVAEEPDAECRVLRAAEAGAGDLNWCGGLIVVTPENLGYLAGATKDFFDRTFYPAQGINLPYMLVVGCGNDGSGAIRQMERIATGIPLRCVGEPVVVRGEPADEDLQAARETGQAMAAGLGMGIF